jgi:hypothetical protein
MKHCGPLGNSFDTEPRKVIPFRQVDTLLADLLVARSALRVAGCAALSDGLSPLDGDALSVLLQDVEERLERVHIAIESAAIVGGAR